VLAGMPPRLPGKRPILGHFSRLPLERRLGDPSRREKSHQAAAEEGGDKAMGRLSPDSRCLNCGTRFGVEHGGGLFFHLLRCDTMRRDQVRQIRGARPDPPALSEGPPGPLLRGQQEVRPLRPRAPGPRAASRGRLLPRGRGVVSRGERGYEAQANRLLIGAFGGALL
jgi:hypothetical protein